MNDEITLAGVTFATPKFATTTISHWGFRDGQVVRHGIHTIRPWSAAYIESTRMRRWLTRKVPRLARFLHQASGDRSVSITYCNFNVGSPLWPERPRNGGVTPVIWTGDMLSRASRSPGYIEGVDVDRFSKGALS